MLCGGWPLASVDDVKRSAALRAICLFLLLGRLLAVGAEEPPESPLLGEIKRLQSVDPQGRLAARLAEAERLTASGDYDTVELVLAEAEVLAVGGGPAAQDAVDRVRAQIAFRRGRYEEARRHYLTILGRASEVDDLAGVARAEQDIALLDRRQGDFVSAQTGLERALALYRKLGDQPGIARVLTHIGLVRLNQGEYSASLEALNESLRLQQGGAPGEVERTYHYLGLLYAGLRDYRSARRFLEAGLAEAHRLADPSREAPLVGSMARVVNLSGAYSEALGIALQSEQLAERMDSDPGRVFAGLEHGRALLGLGRLDEARQVLERGEQVAARIRQRGSLADFRKLLAEIAVRQRRFADARALWDQVLPVYRSGDNQPQLLATWLDMIPVLRELGQDQDALALAQESLRVQEQIASLEMNRRLAVVESEYRAQESQRRIELLERDNEIQRLRLSEEETRRWRGVLVIGALAIIIALLGFRYRESRRMQGRLTTMNQDLSASREALARAHDELAERAEQLARAAATDPLTGISNRRDFMQRFEQHWQDACRRRTALALLLVDIDHFKRINDQHGHAVGDAALVAVADALQATLRAGTLLARWGGEEFAVLLPDADGAAALGLGQRLRQAVAAIQREDLPALTISVGAAAARGGELARLEQLFELTDAALYDAKAAGRDQVRLAQRPEHGAALH
jgi:diguanylate cyclase (GGDEF)-like protein